MAIQRRWILPLGALAAVGLTLGVSTASAPQARFFLKKGLPLLLWKFCRRKRMASP